ncbi:hypothetical protein ACFL59_16650 [Planctomycetota bacterium]
MSSVRTLWTSLAAGSVAVAVICGGVFTIVQGCRHQTRPTFVTGGTFPDMTGSSVRVLSGQLDPATGKMVYDGPDTRASRVGITVTTTQIAQQDTVGAGVLPLLNVAPYTSAPMLWVSGGDYHGFTATGSTTLTSTGPPLRASFTLGRGATAPGVIVNYLTSLSAFTGIGLHLITHQTYNSAIVDANQGFSDYFTVNKGNGDVARVVLPITDGKRLWGPNSHQGFVLTGEVVIGAVTAGLISRANAMGIAVDGYLDFLGADVADGVADGVLHPPLAVETALIWEVLDKSGVPLDWPNHSLSEDLATDIENFIGSGADNSAIGLPALQPLLDQLRAKKGVVLPDVPFISNVVLPTRPGMSAMIRTELRVDRSGGPVCDLPRCGQGRSVRPGGRLRCAARVHSQLRPDHGRHAGADPRWRPGIRNGREPQRTPAQLLQGREREAAEADDYVAIRLSGIR